MGGAETVTVLDLVQSGGIVGLLLYVLVGVMRGWWHTDREFKALEKRENEWKRLALSGTIIAERAVGIYRSEPRAQRRTAKELAFSDDPFEDEPGA